jgi:arylsulfatase A-like enzyme
MTGKTPARVGFTGHITAIGRHRYPEHGPIIPPDDHMNLPLSEVSLARALKPAGYVSASIGKWHLGDRDHWPLAHGFDLNVAGHTQGSPASYFFPYRNPSSEWNPDIPNLDLSRGGESEYLTDRLTDEALGFIRENREKPFFLYLPHYAVHTPLEAPADLIRKYERKLAHDNSQFDAVYAAMVERIDVSLGRLLAALDELGLAENTVVIFSSDNGGLSSSTRNRPLREGKGYLYEGGVRVPLIVRWPGRVRAASVSDEPVMGTDLYPTIVELAGDRARPGATVDGRSLLPLLSGQAATFDRDLYWYYPHYSPQAQKPGAAIRSGFYKLIEHYDPPVVELYNLETDLGEQENLARREPDVTERLLTRLHRLLAEAGTKMHRPNPNYRPQ